MGRETHDKGWECEECGSYNSDLTREFCPLCGKFSNEPSSGLSNPLGYQWYRNDIHDSGYNTVSDTGSSTSPSTTTITGPSSELFVLEQRALYEASLHFQPRVEHDPHKSPLDIALGFASKRASDAASVAAPQIVPYASFYSAPGDSSAAPQSTFFNDASAWSNSEPSSSVTKTRDLVEEVAILFWQDEYIRNMVCGFGNFPLVEALFPSHLERMASELPDEASGPKQIWVAEYVALKSSLISAAFVARAKYVSIRRSEAEGWIFSPNPQNVLSGPGRYHTKGATTSHKIRSGSSAGREDEISLADVDLRSLADLKNFVVDSSAFNRLRKELRKTLYPSLKELLLDRIEYTERQSPSPEMLDEIWHARSLARELNNVDPATVIKCGRTSPGLFTYLQRRIESWTAEQWDWWPLTGPCVHDGTLLQWHCVSVFVDCAVATTNTLQNCGEKICMAVPASLADAVIALSASMSASGPLGRNQRPITPPHSTSPSSQTHSNGQTSSTAQSTIGSPHDPQQVLGSGPSRRAAVRPLRSISGWVFLVVKRGGDYRLSQINVHGHASIDFFRHLRAEYFRLRGLFPRYFSVWVFSHCDFYKVRTIITKLHH